METYKVVSYEEVDYDHIKEEVTYKLTLTYKGFLNIKRTKTKTVVAHPQMNPDKAFHKGKVIIFKD